MAEVNRLTAEKDFELLKSMALTASPNLRIEALRLLYEHSDKPSYGIFEAVFKESAKNDPSAKVRAEACALVRDKAFLKQMVKEEPDVLARNTAKSVLAILARGIIPMPAWIY